MTWARALLRRLGIGGGIGTRGNVAIMTALVTVPVVAFAGMAIDSARIWLVQSRLQAAVDAGDLAATRGMAASGTATDGIALFWANFMPNSSIKGTGYLGAIATIPTVTQPAAGKVMMTSSASVPTTFTALLGFNTVVVTASATAAMLSTGLELSLVLDNTGSMAGWPIQSVISSATSLVNTVYGSGGQDIVSNLWVAVVPFSAEINVGSGNTGWLAPGSYIKSAWSTAGWKGCVMARAKGGNDFTDATPITAPFTPYLWASTLGKYSVGKTAVVGDNDWSTINITEQLQNTLNNNAVGPNLGCPAVPVLPETASRATVLATIAQMAATYRGGTFINLGLQAGWWTLSPNWVGLWGNSKLPLPYGQPLIRKVIVLMTDGNNTWYDWPGGAPGSGPSPWANDGDTDYSAYGRLKQNLMNISNNSQANATTNLNALMTTMCTIIKQHGITIYTILFNHDGGISSDTQTLFQNCASAPADYFLTPTNADLQSAFSQIGAQLTNLRLSQ